MFCRYGKALFKDAHMSPQIARVASADLTLRKIRVSSIGAR